MPSITSISTGLTSLFFFLAGFAVLNSWRREKQNILLKYFNIFLFGIALQQLTFALSAGSITQNSTVNAYLWVTAHVFMFTYLSFVVRLPLSIHVPRVEKIVFFMVCLYCLAGAAILLLNAPRVESRLLENGIFIFKVPAWSVQIIVILTTTCLFPLIAFFFYHAYKEQDKFVRLRSLFIGIAVLVYLTSGPAHNLVTTPGLTFLVDSLLIVSGLFVLAGTYIRKPSPSST